MSLFLDYWLLCIIIIVISSVFDKNSPHYHLTDAFKVFALAWIIVPIFTVGALMDLFTFGPFQRAEDETVQQDEEA